ncbi:MAG: C40 family peptidase [Polaribacter sp.]
MKKWCFLTAILSLMLVSCSASKSAIRIPSRTSKKSAIKSEKIIANALKYKGVRYRYGGITRRGMDCSGLVYVSFLAENIQLPRISRTMAKRGRKVSLKKAKKGDLLFFRTNKKRKRINHVGLVVSVTNGQIRFIHSTTSRGVIVSSLSEKYWKKAFVKVTTVL